MSLRRVLAFPKDSRRGLVERTLLARVGMEPDGVGEFGAAAAVEESVT